MAAPLGTNWERGWVYVAFVSLARGLFSAYHPSEGSMAHVEQRGNSFRLIFRSQGRRYAGALKAADEAEALRGGAEKILHRLEHRLVELPEGDDVLAFVLSDGKVAVRPEPFPT
jgi:hypothetical protein